MGLPISDAAMLVQITKEHGQKETALCLGEPLLGYSFNELKDFCSKISVEINLEPKFDKNQPLTGEMLFKLLGYKEYLSLDISDYEGADIIHNLNDSDLDEKHFNRTDFIYDAGTLEHVFNLPNALQVIYKLLRPGGIVCHHNPSNGYLDHGFYQICPTFYYDYYKANSFSIVSANLVSRLTGTYSEPYTEDIYRNKGMLHGIKKLPRTTLFFCARKTSKSTYNVVPIQSYYNEMHSTFSQKYENEFPFSFKLTELKEVIRYRFPKLASTVKALLGK